MLSLPEYPLPPSTRIQYIPVPGSWAREENPQWSESVFQIPEHVKPGEIHYITKGTFMSMGTHAIIERSPVGYIVKSAKMNPYNRAEERKNRESVAREAAIYQLIGPSPFVPGFVSWDEMSYALTIEGQANKDLKAYVRDNGSHISATIHRKWALEAARALGAVHAAGVTHRDVAPRNFVLDEQLNLRICVLVGVHTRESPFPSTARALDTSPGRGLGGMCLQRWTMCLAWARFSISSPRAKSPTRNWRTRRLSVSLGSNSFPKHTRCNTEESFTLAGQQSLPLPKRLLMLWTGLILIQARLAETIWLLAL